MSVGKLVMVASNDGISSGWKSTRIHHAPPMDSISFHRGWNSTGYSTAFHRTHGMDGFPLDGILLASSLNSTAGAPHDSITPVEFQHAVEFHRPFD